MTPPVPDHRVERVGWDATPLVERLEADEPATAPLISALLDQSALTRRAWTMTHPDGTLAAVFVAARICFDRWDGLLHLPDPAAAEMAASLVDRSVVVSVTGPSEQMRVVTPHLRRARGTESSRWLVAPHPLGDLLGPPDGRARMATALDLPQLLDLYEQYELAQMGTRWQLEEYLRRLLRRHLIVVCDSDDGGLAGAVTIPGRTRQNMLVTDLTVRPEHRRLGIGMELMRRAEQVGSGMRVGAVAAFAASNPAALEGIPLWATDSVTSVWLGHRRRFKGQTRLRRLYGRIQPIERRPRELFWDPADPTRRLDQSDRDGAQRDR